MESQLEKAINLSRKTGDKIIVVDELSESSVVVMDLNEYEQIVEEREIENFEEVDIKSLTEEELLDKINRDIVMWQNRNKEKEFDNFEEDFTEFEEEKKEENEEVEDENMYYYEEAEKVPNLELSEEKEESTKSGWQISSDVKNRAQVIE